MNVSNKIKNRAILFVFLCTLLAGSGCEKLIDAAPARNTLNSENVFQDSITMSAAMIGVYSYTYSGNSATGSFLSNSVNSLLGLSADEMYYFPSKTYDAFLNNALLPTELPLSTAWTQLYKMINMANGEIEGVEGSTAPFVSADLKSRLVGESKFIRALCHFYLVNMFGNIPVITTTNVAVTGSLGQSTEGEVYEQIIKDLTEAAAVLPIDYLLYSNERIRATKWAALALLARVYLYKKDYIKAAETASKVIANKDLFNISPLDQVFLKNSSEAIFQFSTSANTSTQAGTIFIPSATATTPNFVLRPELMSSFEPNDQRPLKWTKSIIYNGTAYPYPYKYKTRGSGNAITEYDMVLRISEQYLIRAEAYAQINNLSGAMADLKVVRERAGLMVSPFGGQTEILAAIERENRVEFFSEWGHRWLDLKRASGFTNPNLTRADEVLGPLKGNFWQSEDINYPLPQAAINTNTNLIQNKGY
ncbi:RagB/SusD family nutrient uptake outer membrane protein [Sphingobacterium sp. DR205]|uniref:RagB/SusD family nutrient uptake outer membrane protein n=1 Tax=Sphingobacterium sp. DR205 TaxID=2713573 RepID=UPI0013E4A3B5|nr:RagB/SusD family nutrient uptake outer membrane protein [Sphingobacterium sp. DR205]QIH35957.1 RagB/SusD family nutrient uptake outer membrane protein [Sphingobacterium sp. DR205]